MKKINQKIAGFGIAMAALAICAGAQQAQAQTDDSTDLTLQVQNLASISATPTLTVTPVLADFIANAVTEVDGITLTIDSTSGSKITWASTPNTDVSTGIRNADITLSSNGSTFVPGDNTTALYSSTEPESGEVVNVDVKIANIKDYAIGSHNSTLTFTIIAN